MFKINPFKVAYMIIFLSFHMPYYAYMYFMCTKIDILDV